MKRTPIKNQSAKKRQAQQERSALVRSLFLDDIGCEIGHVLLSAAVSPWRCSGRLEGIHERRKRSSSGSTVVGANLIPACNWCNGFIEDTLPILAADDPEGFAEIERFLVVREGSPEWPYLGKRAEGLPLEVHRCHLCSRPYCRRGPRLIAGIWRWVPPCGHEQG